LFEKINSVEKLFENINKTMMQKHFEVLRLGGSSKQIWKSRCKRLLILHRYKNWTKISTRGFQNGNQGRTLTLTESFKCQAKNP
jgi:hypothetical protein